MAKGTIAKTFVENRIKECFGKDYIDIVDKKIYVWADDGGEKVQVAISLTCPKNPIQTVDTAKLNFGNPNAGFDFENMDATVKAVPASKNEISEEEQNNIETLMRELGLI